VALRLPGLQNAVNVGRIRRKPPSGKTNARFAGLYSYLDEKMFGNLGQAKKYLGQAAKMLIGIPDYDNYVEHMQTNHPDKPYMSYEEFFRERQQARYGGDGKGGMRCC